MESFFIRKVAVLGAGVMGAQIAAHCANAGIETLLYDLVDKGNDPNGLVNKALSHLKQLKPSPLATAETLNVIQACNYQNDLNQLSECGLVIEAIGERMDWKKDLYQKIAPHLSEQSILVSNTSGLSINALANILPSGLKKRFCGVHFFNPPRYMHLAELIPAKETSADLLNHLETWLTSYLGKDVVRAKDTPNFIANRVGVFSLLVTLHHAEQMGMSIDDVDALTGQLLGRPKSATFRTMDVVGLDTMQHVLGTMQEQLKEDPWHKIFKIPQWLEEMIAKGHLGQKTGQGFYRKNGKTIEVYDKETNSYRPSDAQVSGDVQSIMKEKDFKARMQQLMSSEDKQAQFLAACYRDLFHYCAYHIENIAENVRDVDLAIRWGFGWQEGPFETWQKSGFQEMTRQLDEAIETGQALSNAPLPGWLDGIDAFYTDQGAFSPSSKSYQSRSQLSVYNKQFFPDAVIKEEGSKYKTIFENAGVRLWYLQDEVVVLSFKSKANTISQDVMSGMLEAIDIAENQYKGLIIYQNDASNFSSGADLKQVSMLIKEGKMDEVENMIAQFQKLVMRLRYSSIPTVAALRGRALGGGCEMMLHCDAVVSAFESYPGLVEVGVGVIPAGGGCKEMAMRAAMESGESDLMDRLQVYFKQMATAAVASSAREAKAFDYLKDSDQTVMHRNEVLYVALEKVNYLSRANYLPPLRARFKVAGIEGHARLQTGLVNWLEGGFISEQDYFIVNQLAEVLCGGNLNRGEMVDEEWILKLEKEAFIRLCETEKTQDRINHLLATGKPLRN